MKLKSFLKFNKIRELFKKNSQAVLDNKTEVLASALRDSKKLVLNRLSNMVRRAKDLPTDPEELTAMKREINGRSYALIIINGQQ